MKTKILNAVKVVTLGIALSIAIAYAATWVGPTATPPGGNVTVPISDITFITPVQVKLLGRGYDWLTFDASTANVPAGAKAVILQAWGRNYNYCETAVRKDSSSPSYMLLRDATGDGYDHGFSQGIYPISSSRTFQYISQSSSNICESTIELIGYIK